MTLISLILALLIEQARPIAFQKVIGNPLARYAQSIEDWLNAGESRHGTVAWTIAVVPPVLVAGGLYWLAWWINPLLALLLNVGVLYLTMGFRQFSHYFTDIHIALQAGDIDLARRLLGEWRGRNADRLSSGEVARLAIEQALLTSYRYVFAVVFWFVVLPGPAGAVLYRLTERLGREWGQRDPDEARGFGRFACRALELLDWLPSRMTALCFAIVGNFEDAIHCWRVQSQHWPDRASGILLSSGAGALGVRLGLPVWELGEITDRPELGLGDDADVDFLQSTIGLVWRTLVMCLMLLALVWVASLVG